MVKGSGTAKRRKGNLLRRKLWHDYRQNAMQFLAIVLLCALGVWAYSGLDATWRMMKVTDDTYFEECNLADFWLNDASFSRESIRKVKALPGILDVQARTSMDLDVHGLGNDTSCRVHFFDGDPRINTLRVEQGVMLQDGDLRGCMLDVNFAAANGLAVGDSITFELLGKDHTFIIRGLANAAEHLILAKDVTPDPVHYGFAVISHRAAAVLPFTELIVSLEPGADPDAVEQTLSELLPTALVLAQKSHGSTQRARSDAKMFENMNLIFPPLAFAVAALIVMTTLTRMLEKQRIQMGTLKALGFSDRQIRGHYLGYALWPSAVGALAGLYTGQYTLPYVLWDMEAAHYSYPYQLHQPISLPAWLMCLLQVLLAVLICNHTYNKSARETTASLLRPKPPASGSRILLERIGFLWRRFSFNSKMVVRNLFRNKSRTLMSMIGILCCNMLIICTFGLQDSIAYFIGEYYQGTLKYDMRADVDATADLAQSYERRLQAEKTECIMEKSVSVRSAAASRTVVLTVLEDRQTLIGLAKDHSVLPFPEHGVIMSEKLMTTLQAGLGDTVEVWLPGDDEPLYLTIADTAYTNVGQGIFLCETQWEQFRKGAFKPTAVLMLKQDTLTMHQLEAMDEVTGFKDPADQFRQTLTVLDSASVAFSMLSGVALALAFVICYNMGLMNFAERTRDYATLKVLGYHQREIRRLMMRESEIVSVLGVLTGIPPGIWLVQVILKSCESENMVYAAQVKPVSVLLSCIITFAFSLLIERLLTVKVKQIDMVEALKSVE